MATLIALGLKLLPFKKTFVPIIKSINDLPNYLKAMIISLVGTFVPFTALWFVHLFWGIIIAIVVSKIFSTGTLVSFLIGMVLITIMMFFVYWLFTGVISRGISAFLTSYAPSTGAFGGKRRRHRKLKSKKRTKSVKHRKSRKSKKHRKSRKSKKHRSA